MFGIDVLLRGTPAQKCTFMFDVFDENGDKVLTPEDILRFLRHPGALFAATNNAGSAHSPEAIEAYSQFAEELINMFRCGEAVADLENFDGSLTK